jgi:hypothetical protein
MKNEALELLLTDCAGAPGALGCGVRLPDRSSHVRSHSPSCSKESLERNLVHLANVTTLLAGHDLAAQRLAWTFAGGRIFVAIRPDGAIFSLITQTDAKAVEFFDRMTFQFFSV